jgi:hypothetical protein
MTQLHSSSLWLVFSVAAYSCSFRVLVYIHLAGLMLLASPWKVPLLLIC